MENKFKNKFLNIFSIFFLLGCCFCDVKSIVFLKQTFTIDRQMKPNVNQQQSAVIKLNISIHI